MVSDTSRNHRGRPTLSETLDANLVGLLLKVATTVEDRRCLKQSAGVAVFVKQDVATTVEDRRCLKQLLGLSVSLSTLVATTVEDRRCLKLLKKPGALNIPTSQPPWKTDAV